MGEKILKNSVEIHRIPASVNRWRRILMSEGHCERSATRRAIERAYQEGEISDRVAGELESRLID